MRDLLIFTIALITVNEVSCMMSSSQQQSSQQQAYWPSQGGSQFQLVNRCYDCPQYTLCATYNGRSYCYVPTPSHYQPQRCRQYPNQGWCSGRQIRYYYDMRSRRCERFIYTGCGGNTNNFYYYQGCQRSCQYSGPTINSMGTGSINSNPAIGGSVGTNTVDGSGRNDQVGASVKSQHGVIVHEQTSHVVEAQNGASGQSGATGQAGSGPSYTVDTANIPSRCLLPMDKGPCDSNLFFRYHYDVSSNDCKQFQYSKCGGNSNRFFTLNSCRNTCKQPVP